MLFKAWFYVCKLGLLLFGICFASFFLQQWVPEAKLASTAALMLLVPIAIAGAGLGLALTFFGMRLRCPYCRDKETSIGGHGHVLILECRKCGFVSGNVLKDFKLHVVPPEEDDGVSP